MFWYVNVDGISPDLLAFLGYIFVDENDEFALYSHMGDQIIVDKADMLLKVDDFNDARLLGKTIIQAPSP